MEWNEVEREASEEAVVGAPFLPSSVPAAEAGRAKRSSVQLMPFVFLRVLNKCVPSPTAYREQDADHVCRRDDQIEDDHC